MLKYQDECGSGPLVFSPLGLAILYWKASPVPKRRGNWEVPKYMIKQKFFKRESAPNTTNLSLDEVEDIRNKLLQDRVASFSVWHSLFRGKVAIKTFRLEHDGHPRPSIRHSLD